ncbi:MAG: hypothetical protein JSV61_03100 [Anaerolineales bacterium]|nr:MAG: hypothetical protein JSV61_03100 [Anaerolineales bacterium]
MYRLLIVMLLAILFGSPTQRALAQGSEGTDAPTGTPQSTSIPTSTRATITPVSTTKPEIVILDPLPGQALQGKVNILGTTNITGLQSAEFSFAYVENQTDTWFLIHYSEELAATEILAEWDTTNITDGEYSLRLVVTLQNGSQLSSIVPGLRVRNYTPIETNTPTPITPTSISPSEGLATNTPTQTPLLPTPTPFPPNPAQFTEQDLATSFAQGALLTFGFFSLAGVYILVRKLRSIQ